MPALTIRLWPVQALASLSLLATGAHGQSAGGIIQDRFGPSSGMPVAVTVPLPAAVQVQRLPNRAMINAFAQSLRGTILHRAVYPEAGLFTPREIARALCRSPDPNYMDLLAQRLGLSRQALDTPAGDAVHQWVFPACPKVFRRDDPSRNFAAIAQASRKLAASAGVAAASWSASARGRQYIALPTLTGASPGTTSASTPVSDAGPRIANIPIEEAVAPVGNVVTFARDIAAQYCGPQPMAAIDHQAVLAEIGEARRKYQRVRRDVTEIRIIDNGFAAARSQTGGIAFRDPPFLKLHFTLSDSAEGQPGLPVPVSDTKWAYPVLASLAGDGQSDHGHGTHVTGLVLGGADAPDDWRSQVLLTGQVQESSIFAIEHMNVGNGGRFVSERATDHMMVKLFLMTKKFYVINVSLSFEGEKAADVAASFATFKNSPLGNLFVVAAGNKGGIDLASFPAQSGGRDASNVITVGALRPDGGRAGFSNHGSAVDVLAPGCNLASWVDFDGPPQRMSGTSMSAPIVTFQAALLRSLTGLNAHALKERIIASGDLLHPDDQDASWSGRRINIARSVALFADRLEWHENGVLRRESGQLLQVTDVRCSSRHPPMRRDDLVSVARWSEGAFSDVQIMRNAGTDKLPELCNEPVAGTDAELVFQPEAGGASVTVRWDQVAHFVRRALLN